MPSPTSADSSHAHHSHDHHDDHHHNHSHEGHAHHEEHPHDHAHSHVGHTHHDHGCCAMHGHSHAPGAGFWERNQELLLALGAGVLLGIGFFGERFFGLSPLAARIFYGAAMALGGFKLALHTVPTLLRGRFDIEFLMLAGALGAAFLGQWPEGAFLLFLFALGHALQHHAMNRARDAISALGTLAPKTALVRREGHELEIAVEDIQIGDIALVRPGDRIGVDGVVSSGFSAVDQSPITGESVPVEKAPGEKVFAGTLNGDGALEIEVTSLSRDSTLARVIELVEQAQTQKAPSQLFSEKFERVFVPCVLLVVLAAAIVPPLLGWLSWHQAFYRAISGMVAASPCALALATPSAILAAIAAGARGGVLFKGGAHLENLGEVRAIAFDKTGTLTRGKPEVAAIFSLGDETQTLRLAAALGHDSSHPLSLAVVRRAQSLGVALPDARELQTLRGRGVVAQVENQTVRLGNAAMMREAGLQIPPGIEQKIAQWGEKGWPSTILARGEEVLGALAFADEVRPNAQKALQGLQKLGVKQLVMLTGDNARVAASVAPLVGATEFRADLLPQNKVEAIRELQAQSGKVAMIGDGVNDAPALAHAQVGVAMGATGTGLALEVADVALLADDLEKLPFAVGLSRAAKSIIAQNLLISLGVIALLVPATLLGIAPLAIAVVFHEGSTIVVCLNALRLLGYKP